MTGPLGNRTESDGRNMECTEETGGAAKGGERTKG